MIPNVYTVPRELTCPLFARAFARGCGGDIVEHYTPGPWAGFGSPVTWDSLMMAQRAGDDWYYGDHAYFGRGHFYRVTKNAYQHDGSVDEKTVKHGMGRLKNLGIVPQAWRRGEHIIVCPQSDNHFERWGFGHGEWLQGVLTALGKATDRKVIVHRKRDQKPLARLLRDAHCVIGHTSNAAVDALMAGVPVFCTGPCAARGMGLTDLMMVENPIYPDGRLEFAAMLAANQWSLSEIAQGKCWKEIK